MAADSAFRLNALASLPLRAEALLPRTLPADVGVNPAPARERALGSRSASEPPAPAADLFFWQGMLSPRDSGLLASVLLMVGLGAPLLRRLRSSARSIGAESAAAIVLALLFAVSTRAAIVSENSVVVTAPEVSARSALGPDGVELFVLHEGAEVLLVETHQDHHLVALPDSRKGWVPADTTLSTDPSAPFPRHALMVPERRGAPE